ncbi:FecR domain-containing protein [Deinococcus sp. A31D244]|uniref:FecR domain-containing protein n=1 Tax=Deinococcus sp. A31D244 TaxID=3397675 RepID=UPI0039E191A6
MKVTARPAVLKLHVNLRVAPLTALLLLGGAAFVPLGRASAQTGGTQTAGTTTPRLAQAQGSVEFLGASGTWAPGSAPGTELSTSLRTGTGRAELKSGAGQIVVGSASRLRRYLDEADLLDGRFFLRGPVAVHVQGTHVVMEGAGQMRVDLSGRATRRVAVLQGQARLSLNGRAVTVRAAQQVDLDSGKVTAFREQDPWYASQYRGLGDANIEATRGQVRVDRAGQSRVAVIGDALDPGVTLNTAAGAWAEVGFTGGGYLRLNEQSELNVLAVERTERGREVLLKLSRGTAWNVVQKGQGGYRLDTPVVSTAVRGTVFRVDASGVVKVFEGQVALPGEGDQPVSAGQQRAEAGGVGTLQLDALDRFNQSLDAERARPLTLDLPAGKLQVQDLTLLARSLPDAAVQASVAGRTVTLGGTDGVFRLERLEDTLPEGTYAVTVTATRFGQTLTRQVPLVIDRTAPAVTVQGRREGRVLTLTGRVQDASLTITDGSRAARNRVTLRVTVNGVAYTRTVTAGRPDFQWTLPLATPGSPVTLNATDEAGNERHVEIP